MGRGSVSYSCWDAHDSRPHSENSYEPYILLGANPPLMVTIDFETRSELDVTKVGSYAYAAHPSTDAMCMAWGSENLSPRLWIPGQLYPFGQDVSFLIEAHNVEFEREIWKNVMVKKYGWPEVEEDRWRCSASKARYNSIPGALEKGAEALSLQNRKDTTGHRLMLRMSKPRKPTKKDPDSLWHELPKDKVKLYAYCKQDVATEIELSGRLRNMSRFEFKVWQLDQRMNQRGLLIDEKAVTGAIKIIAEFHEELAPKLEKLTDGKINSLNQTAKVVEWCNGFLPEEDEMPDLTKNTVEKYLKKEWIPGPLRRILELRQSAGKTSVKKLQAMRDRRSPDGRCRGTVLYCGAERTGRWSGTGIQPQNLPRGTLSDLWVEKALKALQRGKLDDVWLIGDPLEVISSCIRRMIVAAPGKTFYCADFKAIEFRVLVWLAGVERALAMLRRGEDPYVDMAAQVFKVKTEDVTSDQRQFGKKLILGLGYQMGWKTFYRQCVDENIDVTPEFCKEAVEFYRYELYRGVSMFWEKCEDAVFKVMQEGGTAYTGLVKWGRRGDFLHATLPSGRALSYYKPEIRQVPVPWDDEQTKAALTYMGINTNTKQWGRQSTYGGKITENLVQAIARDFMAASMIRVEEVGYPLVMTVHDEALAEPDKGFGSLQEFIRIMEVSPQWGAGCPIEADGWEGDRYKK